MLEVLATAEHDAERRASATGSTRPAVTGWGRQAAAYRLAFELLVSGWVEPGEQYTRVSSACDEVELWWYDPADEPDEYPVRLVASDSLAAVTACAYLTLDEAEQLFRDGLSLVDTLRAARTGRDAAPAGSAAVGIPVCVCTGPSYEDAACPLHGEGAGR